MNKNTVVKKILNHKSYQPVGPGKQSQAFAPTNIALCKYWGKRNSEINLPLTASLSISLGQKGALTAIEEIAAEADQIILNGQTVEAATSFGKRLSVFLDLFRPELATRYRVDTHMNIPVAAGLASSACGFAALTLALDQLYDWRLQPAALSILARLGSGSASRSIWQGFVEWQAGEADDGMDSHGILLVHTWPELRVGLHLLSDQQKPLSSREAMQRTVQTSQLYTAWPEQVRKDMIILKQALISKDFATLGQVAEANALAMHATMMSAWPPIIYSQPETIAAMRQVWQLRQSGVEVYFTQDAGPNLKLLFLEKDLPAILQVFSDLQVCSPF